MLQKIRWFVILTGLLLVIVVAFQNQDPVDLNLLFFQGEYPLTLLLLATSAISFVVGSLITALRIRARHKAAEAKAKESRKSADNSKVAAKTDAGASSNAVSDTDQDRGARKTPLQGD